MFGVFDIALGWAWHTSYRARKFWKLRREGALFAAGCVAIIGIIDISRGPIPHAEADRVEASTAARPAIAARPAATARATPVAEEAIAVETIAAVPLPPQRVATVAAAESPALEEDALGAAIRSGKLFTDPLTTASVPEAPARSKAKPARPAQAPPVPD